MRHLRFGALDLFFLSDGTMRLDGGSMFGVVPRVMWEKLAPPDPQNRIPLALNCLLIRSGTTHVLCDTGVGDKDDAAFHERFALDRGPGLLAGLAEIGLGPEDVDVVVSSHLHFDHTGGSTRRDGDRLVPTFPNARHVIQARHLEEAGRANERVRRSYHEESYLPLQEAGVVEKVDGDAEIAPGVRVHLTPGHCSFHQSVIFASGDRAGIFLGDVVPTAAHAPLAYAMAFDVDPVETVETRRRLYREALHHRWLLCLDHETRFPCGYLERQGSTYRIVAAE
ncbi:MAG: MBL fold metallo-hydrolase [Acidobacteriota bacterium]